MATLTHACAMPGLVSRCRSSASLKQRILLCRAASSEDSPKSEGSKGLFSFVTDNPSSRSAIQLPNTPAEDGNLGQMITEIENKGREFGSYKNAGEFSWFVRETGSPEAKKGTVIFLHGAPTQSYSYRIVLEKMAEAGYHCYAPDWIGYGFSERPQPVYYFSYTGVMMECCRGSISSGIRQVAEQDWSGIAIFLSNSGIHRGFLWADMGVKEP